MAFRDLREFLKAASARGEVKVVEGANWDLEIGCITELMAERGGPILLFDSIPGYPKGFRVASNLFTTHKQFALAMGLPLDLPKVEIMRIWKEKTRDIELIPPKRVETGPVVENILKGDDVDLEKIPAPKWHEQDGGRYIGTADMVVVKDPESAWVNVGTYRACIKGRDRLSLWMLDDRHGRLIARKYWARGQSCPVAIVLGCEPAVWMASPAKLKPGVSEWDFAGTLRGEPLEVMQAPLTGLPIPAYAEIVLEGEIPPPEEESIFEGPFGEWPGYYAHTGNEPVVRVRSILHRNDPILLGAPPMAPWIVKNMMSPMLARLWDHVESSGIPGIKGVWGHCRSLMVVISIQQQYAGHAMQALIAAAGLQYGPGMDNLYVAVDEDIDPTNLEQVMWAICTRVDPTEAVHIVKSWTSGLDPRVSPERRRAGDMTAGRMLIDACRPFTWKKDFPRPNYFAPEVRERVLKRWSGTIF